MMTDKDQEPGERGKKHGREEHHPSIVIYCMGLDICPSDRRPVSPSVCLPACQHAAHFVGGFFLGGLRMSSSYLLSSASLAFIVSVKSFSADYNLLLTNCLTEEEDGSPFFA